MGLQIEDVKEKLRDMYEQNDGIQMINGFMDGYIFLNNLKIQSFQDQTPVDEDDAFHKHILLQRYYKKDTAVNEEIHKIIQQTGEDQPFAPLETRSKQECLKELDDTLDEIKQDADISLYFFYREGDEYGFNHDDGIIRLEYAWKEHEHYYDLYAFYAYYGK